MKAYIAHCTDPYNNAIAEDLKRYLTKNHYVLVNECPSPRDNEWHSLFFAKLNIDGDKLGCEAPFEVFFTGDLDLRNIRQAFVSDSLNVAVFKEHGSLLLDGTCIGMSLQCKDQGHTTYKVVERSVRNYVAEADMSVYTLCTYIDDTAARYVINLPNTEETVALKLAKEVLKDIPRSLRSQLNVDPVIAAIELAKYYMNKI